MKLFRIQTFTGLLVYSSFINWRGTFEKGIAANDRHELNTINSRVKTQLFDMYFFDICRQYFRAKGCTSQGHE